MAQLFLCPECSGISEGGKCSCGSEFEGEPIGSIAADLVSDLCRELQARDEAGATFENIDTLEQLLELAREFEIAPGVNVVFDEEYWTVEYDESETEFRSDGPFVILDEAVEHATEIAHEKGLCGCEKGPTAPIAPVDKPN